MLYYVISNTPAELDTLMYEFADMLEECKQLASVNKITKMIHTVDGDSFMFTLKFDTNGISRDKVLNERSLKSMMQTYKKNFEMSKK